LIHFAFLSLVLQADDMPDPIFRGIQVPFDEPIQNDNKPSPVF